MGKPKLAAKTTTYAVPADTDQAWATITCCSATYSAEIDTLRAKFASRSAAVWVRITLVINGTLLRLCLDGKNLYLNAICGKEGKRHHFDDAEGAIPAGSNQASGGAHYSKLQPNGAKKRHHQQDCF